MVVQHNLRAMNSNRMLGLTANVQAKSTEKLSSGYKINRAADDAAGLSISEKMRKQIRGLTQASLNAQDGISAVQTAEGALNEVQDMLQRANELAVKAANGTMSETDRGYIQDEIDQLMTEIDRVAETTKFNETYLLKGYGKKATVAQGDTLTLDGLTKTFNAEEELVAGQKIELGTVVKGKTQLDADDAGSAGATGTVAAGVAEGTYTYADATDVYSLKDATKDLYKVETAADGKLTATKITSAAEYEAAFTAIDADAYDSNPTTVSNTFYAFAAKDAAITGGDGSDTTFPGGLTAIDIDAQATYIEKTTKEAGFYNGATKLDETGLTFANKSAGKTVVIETTEDSLTAATGVTGVDGYTGDLTDYKNGDKVYGYVTVTDDGAGNMTVGLSDTEPENTDPLVLSLHVGADSSDDNQISVSIESMSAKGLGLLTGEKEDGTAALLVDGDNDTNARAAIDTIAKALQKVSTQRSALGAVQNRLEHTIANLDNVVENTTAAESQIRDTDMATEMVKFSNNNILAQAGQAMLAQANQANQGVLSLLG